MLTDPDPLLTLWAMIGAPAGFHRLSWPHREGEQVHWVPTWDRRRFMGLVASGLELDVATVPRRRRADAALEPGWCLWVRCEGKASARLLEHFRPVPTLILREGSSTRLTALWALSYGLRWPGLLRANKRLAHRLRAPKKWADPEAFRFHPPGVVLEAGRGRPCPVGVAFHRVAVYAPLEVVGRLADAPDPGAWRERAA